MGALAHVKIHYTDLENVLTGPICQAIPLYGTFLGGENLYEKTLSGNGILIMGNEGNGIRPAIEAFVNEKVVYPELSGRKRHLRVSQCGYRYSRGLCRVSQTPRESRLNDIYGLNNPA